MLHLFFAVVVAGPMLAPDCQRFCLGECHYDWPHHRCADSRVEYIGTTDGMAPNDYDSEPMSAFDVYYLQDPAPWGTYPTEQ